MTIDDQIRHDKLQQDINREAAKISALLSNKIGQHENLAGEEILPSNQRQIIEQASFICSPSGKAFEKQIKTIEDQGKEQVKALENLKPKEQKVIKDKFDDKLSMQKETYNKLLDERLNEIQEISKGIDFNNLTYHFKTSDISPINFIKFKGPFGFFKEIKNGNIFLIKSEE